MVWPRIKSEMSATGTEGSKVGLLLLIIMQYNTEVLIMTSQGMMTMVVVWAVAVWC